MQPSPLNSVTSARRLDNVLGVSSRRRRNTPIVVPANSKKIGEGVFTTDLLDTIRESIQTHRRITWIFTGSHEITELANATWTSYLVSARTIEVPSFTLAETRLLLTDPLKPSKLWPPDSPKRGRWQSAALQALALADRWSFACFSGFLQNPCHFRPNSPLRPAAPPAQRAWGYGTRSQRRGRAYGLLHAHKL